MIRDRDPLPSNEFCPETHHRGIRDPGSRGHRVRTRRSGIPRGPEPAGHIPATAYFGARIEPRSGESQNDAVQRVESQIGRKFAIDHYYYQWTDSFPNAAQTWTVGLGRIPFINWKAGGSWSSIANGSQDAVIVAHAVATRASVPDLPELPP